MIQSIKRNRLTTSRSEDLVFVHYNLRLLSRKSKEYTDGPTKFWDISKFIVFLILNNATNSV